MYVSSCLYFPLWILIIIWCKSWPSYSIPSLHIDILIYYLACAGSPPLPGLSLVSASGATLPCRAGAPLGTEPGSARGLRSCNTQALELRLGSGDTWGSSRRNTVESSPTGDRTGAPVLPGGFFSAEPPGKPSLCFEMYGCLFLSLSLNFANYLVRQLITFPIPLLCVYLTQPVAYPEFILLPTSSSWCGIYHSVMSDSYIQSLEFSKPESWSGQTFLLPGHLPNPGIKPRSPTL